MGGLPGGYIDSYRIVRGQSDLPAELRDTAGSPMLSTAYLRAALCSLGPMAMGYRSDNFDLENCRLTWPVFFPTPPGLELRGCRYFALAKRGKR